MIPTLGPTVCNFELVGSRGTHMGGSIHGGPQSRPQYILILIIRTPNKGAPDFWKPPHLKLQSSLQDAPLPQGGAPFQSKSFQLIVPETIRPIILGIYIYIYIHICAKTNKCVYMIMCVCIYIYICVYIYTCLSI